MKNKRTILIADSGSTKTDWLLTGEGLPSVTFQSAGMNPFYQSRQEMAITLDTEVVPKLTNRVDDVFFYGAGCADEATGKPVRDAIANIVSVESRIEVASDMLGAARGLCGKEPGLACILGTGANNAFYNGSEIVRSIGSLGFWLGDEGSGSYLGKTLVVHFLQNELPEDLHRSFTQAYPEINRLSVLDHAYKKPFPNRYFASFSGFLSENRQHAFVQHLIRKAFDLFVEKYILKHAEATMHPVHFTGSIAYYYQDLLRESLAGHRLMAGRIVRSPLAGLGEYHLGAYGSF